MLAAERLEVCSRIDVHDRSDRLLDRQDPAQLLPRLVHLLDLGHVSHRAAGRQVG